MATRIATLLDLNFRSPHMKNVAKEKEAPEEASATPPFRASVDADVIFACVSL